MPSSHERLWVATCLGIVVRKFAQIFTSVGRVSQFYDTHWVRFSQSNLQKGSVFPQNIYIYIYILFFYAQQVYQHF